MSDSLDFGPVLPQLGGLGIEFDQRIAAAWRWAANHRADSSGVLRDDGLFEGICRQNPRMLPELDLGWFDEMLSEEGYTQSVDPYSAEAEYQLQRILERAVDGRRQGHTLGTNDLLWAFVEDAITRGDDHAERPWLVDQLAVIYDVYDETTPLSSLPVVRSMPDRLRQRSAGEEDYQYVLTLQGERLVFAVVSVLGDYVQEAKTGLYLPQRALLTHVRDQFGGFTDDEIAELEELINHPQVTEREFQRFFEGHPHFLRRHDYREVRPPATPCGQPGHRNRDV